MAFLEDVVIVSAVRTPIGKFQGSLSDFSAPQLGAIVVREAVKRSGVDPSTVDECIMGNVVSAGLGQNPARQAALGGGLYDSVSAVTINKVCGSGLKAVALGQQAIQTGNSHVVVAGGMESMTNAPYLLQTARKGFRLGDQKVVDSMVHDGLWDIFNNYHMGNTGENVAEKYKITREEQDEYALNSHRKAVSAINECRFKDQIIPVELPSRKEGVLPVLFSKDESPRADTTIEILRSLKPAFKKDGTVTAGNAPGVTDGAIAGRVRDLAGAGIADHCDGPARRGAFAESRPGFGREFLAVPVKRSASVGDVAQKTSAGPDLLTDLDRVEDRSVRIV